MPLALIWRSFLAIFIIACGSAYAHAETLLPVPALSARVIDQTGTLGESDRSAMEQRLAEIEQKEGSQLVVLMVASTAPEDIASFANRVGNTWKIGRREVGDGVLIVVAKNDRKMRIEVAKTLEGAIPDLAAAHIIDQAMKPRFRSGDFAGGLNAAIDQLAARIAGEPLPKPEAGGSGKISGSTWLDIGVPILFVALGAGQLLSALLGKRVGALLLGGASGVAIFVLSASILASLMAAIVAMLYVLFTTGGGISPRIGGGGRGGGSSSGGFSWGDGGSFSDGGFSSGGGGDFGGGGASGDW